jgi:hypothetical protein
MSFRGLPRFRLIRRRLALYDAGCPGSVAAFALRGGTLQTGVGRTQRLPPGPGTQRDQHNSVFPGQQMVGAQPADHIYGCYISQ